MLPRFLLLTLLATSLSAAEPQVPILAYHQVEEVPKLGWSVSRENFRNQMEYLRSAGYHVIPISDLYDYLTRKRDTLPENPVVITVDDGFADAYTNAFPILEKFGYPWSLYVYPHFVGKENALSWPQIRKLAGEGVDVQSHTTNHPHLMRRSHPEMSDEAYATWLTNELAGSKTTIEAQTKHPIRFLAYPYGDFDAGVKAEAAKAGYAIALTSWAGFNTRTTDPLELRRFPMMSDTSLAQFAIGVGGVTLQVHDIVPAPDSVGTPVAIKAFLTSPAEVDPASVRLALLGERSSSTYDPQAGAVTLETPRLHRARQTIVVYAERASDRKPMLASWTFYTTDAAKTQYEEWNRKLRELPLHHTDTKRQ